MQHICFLADKTELAQTSLKNLRKTYGCSGAENADVFVVLGGDGFMLQTLHRYIGKGIPFYGMNCGSVGFLMNKYQEKDLPERLNNAGLITLRPLVMEAYAANGKYKKAWAFNEVSLWRQSRQTADISISVDGVQKLPDLICDGVLLSTPAGSTAYNFSAHGPILPLASNVLALTPISPFRPRRWQGAILPRHATVSFTIRQSEKRPVSAVADFTELRHAVQVTVREDPSIGLHLLFDPERNLEDRVLDEQFSG
ncbi:MAG: NAD kinase [Alphaproteobacteria bacterium]|nr:NAD kinase [Alphaproteobacteria bacterium]MBO4643064.1 NAD kinase [Alphaproteobacteria bacterium]